MAYAVKYSGTYQGVDETSSQVTITVELLQEGYAGSPSGLTVADVPHLRTQLGPDALEPVCPSSASVPLVDSAGGAVYSDLDGAAPEEWLLRIKAGSAVEFTGFVRTETLTKSLDDPGREFVVKADDGLGAAGLQAIRYEPDEGFTVTGSVSLLGMLVAILGRLGLGLDLYTSSSLYPYVPGGPQYTATDDPLSKETWTAENVAQENEGRVDSGGDPVTEYLSCDFVLRQVLQSHNLQLLQAEGAWQVRSLHDLRASTPYVRFRYNAAGALQGSAPYDPVTSLTADEIKALRESGASEDGDPAYRSASVRYHHGPFKNQIVRNGSFESFNAPAGLPWHWASNDASEVSEVRGFARSGQRSVQLQAHFVIYDGEEETALDRSLQYQTYIEQRGGTITGGGGNTMILSFWAHTVLQEDRTLVVPDNRFIAFEWWVGNYYWDLENGWTLSGTGPGSEGGEDGDVAAKQELPLPPSRWEFYRIASDEVPVTGTEVRRLWNVVEQRLLEDAHGPGQDDYDVEAVLYDDVAVDFFTAGEVETDAVLHKAVWASGVSVVPDREPVDVIMGSGPLATYQRTLTLPSGDLATDYHRGPYGADPQTGDTLARAVAAIWAKSLVDRRRRHDGVRLFREAGALNALSVISIAGTRYRWLSFEKEYEAGAVSGSLLELTESGTEPQVDPIKEENPGLLLPFGGDAALFIYALSALRGMIGGEVPICRTTATITPGVVTSLQVTQIDEALLDAGDLISLYDSREPERLSFRMAANQAKGATTLSVEDPVNPGVGLTVARPIAPLSAIYRDRGEHYLEFILTKYAFLLSIKAGAIAELAEDITAESRAGGSIKTTPLQVGLDDGDEFYVLNGGTGAQVLAVVAGDHPSGATPVALTSHDPDPMTASAGDAIRFTDKTIQSKIQANADAIVLRVLKTVYRAGMRQGQVCQIDNEGGYAGAQTSLSVEASEEDIEAGVNLEILRLSDGTISKVTTSVKATHPFTTISIASATVNCDDADPVFIAGGFLAQMYSQLILKADQAALQVVSALVSNLNTSGYAAQVNTAQSLGSHTSISLKNVQETIKAGDQLILRAASGVAYRLKNVAHSGGDVPTGAGPFTVTHTAQTYECAVGDAVIEGSLSSINLLLNDIIIETRAMRTGSWNGTIDASGNITAFTSAYPAWCITDGGQFEFAQNAGSYIRFKTGGNLELKSAGGAVQINENGLTIKFDPSETIGVANKLEFVNVNTDESYADLYYDIDDGYVHLLAWNQARNAFRALSFGNDGFLIYDPPSTYTIWHEGNDGAGSGLDADKLAGFAESAFGRLAAARTWTALQTFAAGIALADLAEAAFGSANNGGRIRNNTLDDTFELRSRNANGGTVQTILLLGDNASGVAETLAKFIPDGAAELYYDNSKKLETTAAGAKVTGTLEVTGGLDADTLGGQAGSYYRDWDNLTNVPTTLLIIPILHGAATFDTGTYSASPPATWAELHVRLRKRVNLSKYGYVRFHARCNVAGNGSGQVRVNYATSEGGTYTKLADTDLILTMSSAAIQSTDWYEIEPGAQGDVYLRVEFQNTNTSGPDFSLGSMYLEVGK